MNVGAAGGAGEHWLGWKGGRAGAGGGGVWGRPTSDVDHVPTQRSLPALCPNIAGSIASRSRAAVMNAPKTNCLFVDLMAVILLRLLRRGGTGQIAIKKGREAAYQLWAWPVG